MARAKIKRGLLAVVVESPSYFSTPLQMRSGSLNFFSPRSIYYRLYAYDQGVIGEECYLKMAEFDKSRDNLNS